jgi:hypothetical protein
VRRLIAAGSALLAIAVILVVAQLVLPGIAADHIRDQLSKNGKVLEVDVSAFPAIELLWHQADSVTVKMANYRSASSHLASLLEQSADVGTLHASAQVMTAGLLTLHNASLTKLGNTLTGTAQVRESDIAAAAGGLVHSVTPVTSSNGQLVLQGTVGVSVLSATVDAVVAAQHGSLVLGVPVLGDITLFDDPHVFVDSVGASGSPGGFVVTARGYLH